MKKLILLTLAVLPFVSAKAQHSHTPMQNTFDSMSYAVGLNIASSLVNGAIDTLNMNLFMDRRTILKRLFKEVARRGIF